MKLILRIGNLFPLFLALLILSTGWKIAWQHAAKSSNSVVRALAGAAAYQLN